MSQVTQQSVLACKSNGALQDEVVLDVLPASKSKGVKTSRSWSSNGIQTIAGQSTMKRAKKRRKVNHGMTKRQNSSIQCNVTSANLSSLCSMPILSPFGKLQPGPPLNCLHLLRGASLADNATHV